MLHLNIQGLRNKSGWQAAHIALPRYDVSAMQERTLRHPVWIHFGAGNIFRAFLAAAQQSLLNAGLTDTGIVAAALVVHGFGMKLSGRMDGGAPFEKIRKWDAKHPDQEIGTYADPVAGGPVLDDELLQKNAEPRNND